MERRSSRRKRNCPGVLEGRRANGLGLVFYAPLHTCRIFAPIYCRPPRGAHDSDAAETFYHLSILGTDLLGHAESGSYTRIVSSTTCINVLNASSESVLEEESWADLRRLNNTAPSRGIRRPRRIGIAIPITKTRIERNNMAYLLIAAYRWPPASHDEESSHLCRTA